MFVFRTKKSHGFGRSETEAICNCIKNFIETLLEEDENLSVNVSNLKQALKISNKTNKNCLKILKIIEKNQKNRKNAQIS